LGWILRVAVYTIALNEEQFVERWFESAKDADYLLIADTGSSDKTVELAKSFGINVISVNIVPWRFDDARNAALAHIPTDIDYCISLDMDEVIVGDWRKQLEECLSDGITRPKYKHIWSWKEDGTPGLEFAYDHIHARKGYRWKHPVHEILQPYGIPEKTAFVEGVETHHHPDPSKSRSQYLPLLNLAVSEDPHNDRNTYYYARELFFHNQFAESKKQFIKYLAMPTATWNAERSSAMRYIAKCSVTEEKEQWLIKAFQEAPNRREPLVDLAKFYYEQKKWDNCLKYSELAIAIKEKPLEYLCEEEAWGDLPYDLAAISSYNLQDFQKAISHGEMAIQENPLDNRLKVNLVFYHQAIKNK
jgi:glycosyltransferase involved in cell wall biosynthesis